ncbi:7078_t:CDS:10 [Ambispora leptoticha]|uniref:7078_t:CDS:1 n=1 Tax=Ambispora leptoticha TaxID=144679 RepID=A0A9N9FQ15_9GLOM|nr:7078_t:CDS:10 [Ambispora leptoticha]
MFLIHLLILFTFLSLLTLFSLFSLYLLALGYFVWSPKFQSYFIFAHFLNFPHRVELDKPEVFGLQAFSARHITLTTPDNLKLGVWHILSRHNLRRMLPSLRIEASKGEYQHDSLFDNGMKKADLVIIYFHGQVGNRGKENRVMTYKALRVALPTADIVTFDYRGFGDSEGFPSEEGVLIDSRAVFNWVIERVPANKVIIYGHSLGSGIATKLARQLSAEGIRPLALILEAPFTSVGDMMTAYRKIPFMKPFLKYPKILDFFRKSLAHPLNNSENIKNIHDMPLLILHSRKDMDIPASFSHLLFEQYLASHKSDDTVSATTTVIEFEREGTLYARKDLKAWYLRVLHAEHNNVHHWEFVGEKLREFMEEECGLKLNISDDLHTNMVKVIEQPE